LRTHHEYGAYCIAVPTPGNARLFSLKVETLSLGSARRRFVDAVLLDGERVSIVPFIRVCSDGSIIMQERYANLPGVLVAALVQQTQKWLQSKGADAVLDATTFLRDIEIEEALALSETNGRALPGLAPYGVLFDEAERYANLTPYVRGRHVADLNGGFGYGVHTLAQVANSVTALPGGSVSLAQRLWGGRELAPPDVAVYLDASGDVADTLELARELAPSARLVLVSQKGQEAADAIQRAGAEAVKMRRPGCESLGDLDETLGVFRLDAARVTTVPELTPRSNVSVSPKPLKVLFALRPSSETAFGGDVVQVYETAKALRARGHDVQVSTSSRLSPHGFDVVHLSNLTSVAETLAQAQSVSDFDGAVAMMPIYIDHADETMWGMFSTLGAFLSSESDEDLQAKLSALERRALSVEHLQPPPARNEMMPGYESMQRAILANVDLLIANAHTEVHRIYRYLDCSIPYQIAPSAAAPATYGAFARAAFSSRYGFDDFVLIAGRYEPRKNQLILFEALRGLGYPLVCIGSNVEAPIAHALRAYRPSDVSYIGFLAESELAGAFAAARVVAIPSWDEVVSLTSLNAAISAASLVLTRNSYEHEYFRDDAEYCDPGSVESLKGALRRAWESHDRRAARRRALARRVTHEYSWERSAELVESAYYRILQDNPRREERLRRAAGEKAHRGSR
jgi:glycosyltransferase involved in cell wall biosynthesis